MTDIPRGLRAELAMLAREEAAPEPKLGRYDIVERLGEGGMAVVYRAHDRELDRTVAVKVLKDVALEKPGARERFEREARALARLAHPNILKIHDAADDGGRPYLVMEYLRGAPLGAMLASRRGERRPLLEILVKVARAVHYCHENGVVHRDLKPGNILIPEQGEPRVADFGLAHLADSQSLTRSGAMLGTPAYMAPEQIEGRPGAIGPRTDVYALGVILYEILAGRPPHLGSTPAEIYRRILTEPPEAPHVADPGVPRDLETIAQRAMEHDPSARFASAAEFADDLQRHLDRKPILARPPSMRTRVTRWVRRHRVLTTAAFVGAAAIAVIAAVVAGQRAERRRELRARLEEGQARSDELDALRGRLTAAPSDELEQRAAIAYANALGEFHAALGIDPADRRARAALARLYHDAWRRADEEGDARTRRLNDRLVRLFDDGTYASRMDAPARIEIESRAAEVRVFRYEEGPDGRLEARPAGASLDVPPGSYLVVLRAEGFRDVRWPVLAAPGARIRARVNFYTDAEIGDDFVLVPAGPFIRGAGDEAYNAEPRDRAASVDADFFIGRFEVTMGAYLDFLRDLVAAGRKDEAAARLPRRRNGETLAPPLDPKWPAIGISVEDAEAYAAWLSKRHGGAYRLPTSIEWEKAARGADGRRFPWGDRFDWGFMLGGKTRPDGREGPEHAGAYAADESPYGARDMAGSVSEMCADWFDEVRERRHVRGGAWAHDVAVSFHVASRRFWASRDVGTSEGFRLIKVPPKR